MFYAAGVLLLSILPIPRSNEKISSNSEVSGTVATV